jgi:branched-chain amino acid transport system ATP-binding protein
MTTQNSEVVLSLQDLHLSFGGVKAVDGLSCEVRQGEVLGIIGPNGAGKTSTLNCISGFYQAQKGDIYFQGQRITRLRPDRIARLGISRTFQNIQLYTGLTVVENLMAARHFYFKYAWLEGALYLGRAHREEVRHRAAVEQVIDFLELQRYRNSVVAALPYGIRKRIDLGRSLAQEPRLILLDEPMAGMNVEEKEDMSRFILDVREEKGITIILIEHDMAVVMDITDRIMTLDFGRKIAEGTPDEIKHDPAVIKAYLGDEMATAAPEGGSPCRNLS